MNQGDVKLIIEDNVGNIIIENGMVQMDGGLQGFVLLSLFGGNIADDGSSGTDLKTWWGNRLENDNDYKYVSRTQYILRNLPVSTNNILKLNEAIKLDLQAMISQKIATEINSEVVTVGLNRIKITINIVSQGKKEEFTYYVNWENDIKG